MNISTKEPNKQKKKRSHGNTTHVISYANIKSYPTIINKNIGRFIYQGLGDRVYPPKLQSGANEVQFPVCKESAIALITTTPQFSTLFPRNNWMKKNLLASQTIRTPLLKSRLQIINWKHRLEVHQIQWIDWIQPNYLSTELNNNNK